MTETIVIVATGLLVALSVFLGLNIGAKTMSEALSRLTAAVNTIAAGVARIGTEVSETASAIRDHVTGDSGISQSDVLAAVDKLDAAGAALTDAANQLDGLQSDLSASGDEASGDPAGLPEQPVGELADTGVGEPPIAAPDVPPVDLAVSGELGSEQPAGEQPFGNQNGVGSEFETGDAGDGSGLGGQDDAASDVSAGDQSGGEFGSSDAGDGTGSESDRQG